jgi:hypothetical protein
MDNRKPLPYYHELPQKIVDTLNKLCIKYEKYSRFVKIYNCYAFAYSTRPTLELIPDWIAMPITFRVHAERDGISHNIYTLIRAAINGYVSKQQKPAAVKPVVAEAPQTVKLPVWSELPKDVQGKLVNAYWTSANYPRNIYDAFREVLNTPVSPPPPQYYFHGVYDE